LPLRFDRASGMVEGVKAFLNPGDARQRGSEQREKVERREKIESKKREFESKKQELSQAVEGMYAVRDAAERGERIKGAIKKKLELFELRNELRAIRRSRQGDAPDDERKAARTAGWSQAGALPDFVVIGAAKSGTSFFYHLLTRHPLVQPPAFKEPHYFNFVAEDEGVEWYRRCFPQPRWEGGRRTITGEASPGYLSHALAPERMAEVIPGVRLIALLRNPVERTYSAYHWRVQHWQETRTFEEAIEADRDDGAGPQLSNSIYVDQLMRWMRFFPREQLLVIKSEELFESPTETLKAAFEFLGLPEWEPGDEVLESSKRNKGTYEDEMDPSTRRRLEEYFEPHNRRLYDFLGTDFGW
jgi:hypothetical protein